MAEVHSTDAPAALYDFGSEPVQLVLDVTNSKWTITPAAAHNDVESIQFTSHGDWDVTILRAPVAQPMPGQSKTAGFATQAEFMSAARNPRWDWDIPDPQPHIFAGWDGVLSCVKLTTCAAEGRDDDFDDDQLQAIAARVCGGVRKVLRVQQTRADGNFYEAYALVELGNGAQAHYALLYCTS